MAIFYVNMMDKFSDIINKVQTLQDIKHTKRNVDDTCTLLLSMLKQLQNDFSQFTDETRKRHEKELDRNLGYYEKLEIEYSTEVDFSEIYQYKAIEDVCMSSAILKDMVYSERKFRNINGEQLHARIVLTDLDPEFVEV